MNCVNKNFSNNKKLLITFLVSIIVILGLSYVITILILQYYNRQVLYFSNIVVGEVLDKYNISDKELIDQIFNLENQKKANEIIQKYGIDEENIHYLTNEISSKLYIFILLIGLTFVIFVLFFYCVYRYIRRQNRIIEKLTQYADDIENKDCHLDIGDNDESNISKLKNKIYDMSVRLKEQNLLLQDDKIKMEKLIADISHQLKTPLTSLNILNELLYEDLPNEKRQQFLNEMAKELTKIEWLIKNILNIAKIDSKTLILKRETTNLYELLQKCKNSFVSYCELMDVQIKIIGSKEITVKIDHKWTLEAINNLIKNAIEHDAKHITLEFETNQISTKLIVRDDGEGISQKDRRHIFERFYKAQNSKSNSVGLGLAFVKSILENQNAKIRYNTMYQDGTEFIIQFYDYDI